MCRKCYMCDSPLTGENETEEHIVLNAIGGFLKSKELICKNCNSHFGNEIDNALVNELKFFANQINVKRQRGENPDIVMDDPATGEKVKRSADGKLSPLKPEYKEIQEGKNTKIEVKARNQKELDCIMKGVLRKYPEISQEDVTANTHIVQEPVDGHLHVQLAFGNELSKVSVLKTAINFFIYKRKNAQIVFDAISDLKRKSASSRVEQIMLVNSPFHGKQSIVHGMYIHAKDGKIYVFVEFFSCIQFIVKLSDKYDGEDFVDSYVFDVEKTEVVEKKVNPYTDDVNAVFEYKFENNEENRAIIKQNIECFMKLAGQYNDSKDVAEIVNKNLSSNEGVITQEQLDGLKRDIMSLIKKKFGVE